MLPDFIEHRQTRLPSNVECYSLRVNRDQWLQTADAMRESGAQFLSLWGTDDRDRDGCFRVCAAWLLPQRVLVAEHATCDMDNPSYPGIAALFPAASRMQRGTYDLLGISAEDSDRRGWLRHGGWPETVFPLRRDVDGSQQYPVAPGPYPFVTVEGDGVHEIAVGPVHAGTIEPGHFRFSVVGEKVLRLEEQLGYKHKGIAKLFETFTQQGGHTLAARVSGDSAVAFSWAWCAALESATSAACPERAVVLRALALEHERIANHLGDLGALGNDAGFAFGLTQFSRLKEDLLRANADAFNARYLMDYILPGGVAVDFPGRRRGLFLNLYRHLEAEVIRLRSIYDEHAGVQDRFRGTGRLAREVAAKLGAVGMAARASGISSDLRLSHPWPPYDRLPAKLVMQNAGDVAARVQVRFAEVLESLRLCRTLLENMPSGPIRTAVPVAPPNRPGFGLIEGWRGPVMVALETGKDSGIRRCHTHDPSWQNWPLLEYAILGNIVPDFPLINKSFNLSYSGQDG